MITAKEEVENSPLLVFPWSFSLAVGVGDVVFFSARIIYFERSNRSVSEHPIRGCNSTRPKPRGFWKEKAVPVVRQMICWAPI